MKEQLVVVWTSEDREVALKMVFMYTLNSRLRDWWPHVTLIVWGPSARLLSEDAELQESIREMKEAGVEIRACKACSDMYGVTKFLAGLGIDVIYIGETFTNILKSGCRVITF